MAVLVAMVLHANRAYAQEIRGTVRDTVAGLSLAGAVVQLLDGGNRTLTRALSDEAGTYRLNVPAGAERLLVLRIGYRPVTRNLPRNLQATQKIDIAMARLPQRLEAIRVTQNANCPRRKDAGEAFALWQEAQAGLLATVVARESRPAKMRLSGFTQVMRRGLNGIDHQLVRILDTAAAKQSYMAVLGAGGFATEGFMTEDSTGKRFYYAPDADVLLDQEFLATYCFSLANGDRDHPGQTGLAFEPAPGGGRDTLVEVRGTLWLDRSAAELRTLEFRYLNLEPATARAQSGGKESFLSLKNGVTVIDHWEIRFPIVGGATLNGVLHVGNRDLYVHRPDNTSAWLSSVYVSGGQLISAEWPDGFAWHAKLATVRGRAVDTVGKPLPGVTIVGDSTDYTAVSDAAGEFTIRDVLPGPYKLYSTIPELVRLGVRTSPYVDVDMDTADADVRVVARVGEAARDYFCDFVAAERQAKDSLLTKGSMAFVARATYADNAPVTDLDMRAIWYRVKLAPRGRPGDVDSIQADPTHNVFGGRWRIDVRPNAQGRFTMCGVPFVGARLYVYRGDEELMNESLTFPSRDYIQGISLKLPFTSGQGVGKRRTETATDSDFVAEMSSIEGLVHDGGGNGLPGVAIVVRSTEGPTVFADEQGRLRFDSLLTVSTDYAGHFRVDRLRPGSYTVTATRKGLAARTVSVDLPPSYRMQMNVPMTGSRP